MDREVGWIWVGARSVLGSGIGRIWVGDWVGFGYGARSGLGRRIGRIWVGIGSSDFGRGVGRI